ncbi:Hypothetical predicted protein, partial [Pelobates cultripes]
GKERSASRLRSSTRAARSLTYKCDRVASEGEGSVRSRSPLGSSASRLLVSAGGASAVRPKTFKGTVRAIISPEDNSMELGAEVLQTSSYSALPQRISHDATTNMAASPHIVYSTPKMATATSNMATTTFKAATYNPNMPPELAEDLPLSAGMIIQLIKDLRVDLKNYFKKDFDALYGAMEGIKKRTEITENRLHSQEQSHLDLVETVKASGKVSGCRV